MSEKKRIHPEEKSGVHPRSKHKGRYDFKRLIGVYPELDNYVIKNKFGDLSVNFFDPKAVKALNAAILKLHYQIDWDIPEGYLCPPIPGRAEYVHRMADLLADNNEGQIPKGDKITCLDVGIGANCIYPIIGVQEYGWTFIGSDVNEVSIESAQKIIDNNPVLNSNVDVRRQNNSDLIFQGVLKKGEKVDVVICNPPFHGSEAEAKKGTVRKLKNLKHQKKVIPTLNFGGQQNEIWYPGGEKKFVHNMIRQSQDFTDSCFWFTALVSKQTLLKGIYKFLKDVGATDIKTIEMSQGNKTSRIVAWTFLSEESRSLWTKKRWQQELG